MAKYIRKKDDRTPFNIGVGRRLRETRLVLDYDTTRSFAEALGIQEDRLGKWENGDVPIPPLYARQLKVRFAITTDWLYTGDPSGLPAGLYRALKDFIESEDEM